MPENWHVTVIKTRTPIDTDALVGDTAELVLPASDHRLVIRMGEGAEFVALAFRSSVLASRHHQFRAAGAETDHRQFRSHVTFAVAGGYALDGFKSYSGALVFGGEVWI